MKKHVFLVLALAASFALQAQWVDDPMTNTFIANSSSSAAEIRVAPSVDGGTFVQWTSMSENGWSPKLQLLDAEGVPQWGPDGVVITTDNIATWSPGYAIAALSDGSVVSMFRTADARHWVVKINADGSTPWGTDGLLLFDGEGGGRSELLAGDDGGFWALGTDMDNSFLCYVNADGTFNPMVTISDPAKKCSNGVMVPAPDGVFVVYSKHTLQGYTTYNKEIYLAGYNKNGEMIVSETLLFGLQSVEASYVHYAIPDGMGGGYVFQWHSGIGGAYNTYVTHFDAEGNPTISDPNGVPVHSIDPGNFYINAYPTIDPVTHDLLLVYRQTESASQSQYIINVNRITANGEKPWGDGILVLDNGTSHLYNLRIDAFEPEYGGGFTVIYHKDVPGAFAQTVEAQSFDMDGNAIWSTQMCSNPYPKTGDENSTGFHNGQNVVTWVNAQDGGVYGQNIGTDGTMGHIEPIITCYPPQNFEGEYFYDMQQELFGVKLFWVAPETQPLHYNLYRYEGITKDAVIIEVPGDATSYFDESGLGIYRYQLTAVYENCESDFALTPDGENSIYLEVTGMEESSNERIVTVVRIFTVSGQCLKHNNVEELTNGLYILQGLTEDGQWVNQKVVINK